MSGGLDMSLDDIIKSSKSKKAGSGNFRGRGRASGPGPARRAPIRAGVRAAPYTAPPAKAPDAPWRHDMFVDQPMAYQSLAGRASSIETGAKLYISNLDYGVSNEDIKELFSEVGDLKKYSLHYDRSGRSKGTAEVVFSRLSDAMAAVKRYDGVQLDGKPMKIEIVGSNIATSAPPAAANSNFRNANGFPRGGYVRGGVRGRLRGGNVGGRGHGRGRGRGQGRGGRGEKVSAEDLDADLEKYHSEIMQD